MDIIDISLATKKAILELEKSGKVAKSTIHTRDEHTPVIIGANEDLGGLHGAIVEGTFGVKPTDMSVSFLYRDSAGVLREMWLGKTPVANPLYVGNRSIAGLGEDTGERWLIVIDFEQNTSLIFYHNGDFDGEAITIESRIEFETIVPIDPKFLPGVCLPVVELTTEITEVNVTLTTEESAKLEAAANMNLPCVIKCVVMGQLINGVFFLGGSSESPSFMFNLATAAVNITRLNDTEWEAMFITM